MTGARSLNSGAFRFALAIATVFAIGSALLFLVVERSIRGYAAEATSVGLRAETTIMTGEFADGGMRAVIATIDRRRHVGFEQPFRYGLVDAAGRRLAGDLPAAKLVPGWATVSFADEGTGGEASDAEVLQGLGTRLDDGSLLVVATDTFDIQKLRRQVDTDTLALGVLLTLLVLAGGYAVGALFLRRLDRVNGALGRIVDGELSERLPTIGMSPEFDRLSASLNVMLDRIQGLIESLRQVSTDIAHDLRTPLTRLRQQLETVREGGTIAEYEQGVDVALAQTDELLAIFRALLRIGMLESGEGRLRLSDVDLTELLTRVTQAYQPVADDKAQVLTMAIAPGIRILGDAELLPQLFTNLIENAITHTPPGTAITVSLSADRGAVLASVVDDGPGIPGWATEKVLTRFFRVDGSRRVPGAGLGLSLVAAIVRLHGAHLALRDKEPGLIAEVGFPWPSQDH